MTDRAVQFLGYGSALLTTASFFPQALKVLRTNETRGFPCACICFSVLVCWVNLITFPATAAILDRKIRAQLLLSRKGYEQGQ